MSPPPVVQVRFLTEEEHAGGAVTHRTFIVPIWMLRAVRGSVETLSLVGRHLRNDWV